MKLLTKILPLTLLIAGLAGCLKEKIEPVPAVQGGEATFTVSVPGMQTPSTRALDANKEKQLTAIDVVIFSNVGNTLLEHHRVAASDIVGGTGGNDYQFRVKGIENTSNVTLAVIANASGEVAAALAAVTTAGTYVGAAKTAFLSKLQVSAGAKWDTSPGGYRTIPMYGEITVTGNIYDAVTNTVNLTRMLAKVDVLNNVAPESPASPADGDFELTAVHVVNRNTAGLIAPKWNASGAPEPPPATTPNFPAGFAPGMVTWADGNQLTYTLSTGDTSLENEIYLFESAALSDNPATPNGLRLVFEGNYTSGGVTKKYYYPVDFTTPTGAYMPVLRNHRYLFTITEAAGRGYDGLGEAVAAFGVMSNLRTSLVVVDESGIRHMVWNGEHFLGVSEKSFTVAAAGQNVELQVSTNYTGGWSAAVENPAANSWLTLGAASGQLTDKTLTFSAAANNSGIDRTATVTFTAGRLMLAVTVDQPKIIEFYPPMHGGWAGSNIYWDGGKLTFDDVGATANQQVQGVYFQWGSLTGISPVGAYTTNPTLYPPTGGTTSGTPWTSIPRVGDENITSHPPTGTSPSNPPAAYSARDRGYLYEITNGVAGIGDICKYLTEKAGGTIHGKRWRMPTSHEFEAVSGAYGTVGSYGTQTSDNAAGKYIINSYKTKTGAGNPWFPASGYRTNSDGSLGPVGQFGYHWSGSPNGTLGYCLSFDGSGIYPALYNTRVFGFSVRCVAEESFIVAEPASSYLLDGTTLHSFKVKSNTQWAVRSIYDPNNLLLNPSAVSALTGGNNAITGDNFTFRLVSGNGSLSGKTFTVTFYDPTGRASDIQVTVNSLFVFEIAGFYVWTSDQPTGQDWVYYTNTTNSIYEYIVPPGSGTQRVPPNPYSCPALPTPDPLKPWRLPNNTELVSIIGNVRTNNTWTAHGFTNGADYLTAHSESNWGSCFILKTSVPGDNGYTNVVSKTATNIRARCVRSK